MDQRESFDSEHAVKAAADETGTIHVAQNSVQFLGPMGESSAPAPSAAPTPAPAPTTSRTSKGKKKRGHSQCQLHELTVNPGEDVIVKIISLSLQATHAICIYSANGTISKVTIHDEVPGESSTFEGSFKIISLKGSFIPMDNGSPEKRCGGLSVWFELLNGDTRGGALAGSMVAAGPVKVVVGCFPLPGRAPEPRVTNS